MGILLTILVVVVCLAILVWALQSAPIPQPFNWIVILVVALIAIYVIARSSGIAV